MTYNEFLTKLAETPRDWFLDPQQRIRYPQRRNESFPCCPLNRIGPQFEHRPEWCYSVIHAADLNHMFQHVDMQVRADLLTACGL